MAKFYILYGLPVGETRSFMEELIIDDSARIVYRPILEKVINNPTHKIHTMFHALRIAEIDQKPEFPDFTKCINL